MQKKSNPLATEFALASDGVLYVHIPEEDEAPAGRTIFVGYALLPGEASRFGPGGLLAWGLLQKLALGSDGRIYVEEGAIDVGERQCFRGYAATADETELLVDELHKMAFNATCALTRARRQNEPT